MKADLHCHTVLSDGAMRVDQIMPYAKRIGLIILQSLTTNQHIPFRKL